MVFTHRLHLLGDHRTILLSRMGGSADWKMTGIAIVGIRRTARGGPGGLSLSLWRTRIAGDDLGEGHLRLGRSVGSINR